MTSAQSSAARADELFRAHQQEIYRGTDKLFARLMVVQWLAAIIAAVVISPRTWVGQTSQVHIHVWASLIIGGLITVFPVWLTRAWPGAAITRYVIAVAQMLMSALLISVTGGRIETHFHVFGSLVILSFYRDWRVLVPATVVVALDHFLRGIYWPYSVYGVLTASPWRSIEHAGWVIFEDVFLVISCFRSIREMRSIANRTAALEASEQNFRQIFEEAPIGMAVVGLDEKFRQANGALCHMLDYSEEELRRRTPFDLTHPEDLESSRELAKLMLADKSHSSIEKRYVRRNSDVVWARRTGRVIRDENGDPRHFLIMIEDISVRKEAEQALHESKRQLEYALQANQSIMDNSQDVICTVDENGRFLTVNAACQDLLGYAPAELIGRFYFDFVYPQDRVRTSEADTVTRKSGRLTDFVNRYVRKDGSIVHVLWSASWAETEKIFFCVAHDVTERQRAEEKMLEAKEEADRANKAKSEFLSRMSHELRTPLNAILGFSQLLERQKPTEVQRTRIAYIINAGRHLLELINEVLDISRIEAGRMQLSVEPVCVGHALGEAIDLMRTLAADRSIELIASTDGNNSSYVLADRQRFKQVLLNLLTNAIKYTPPGGRVTVSAAPASRDRHRIVVSDTGPGISAENMSRLFTPFDRLGAEQSDVQGTGLGLAVSQRLIQAMGGSIGVNSDAGRGSTFWVELPRTNSPLERAVKPNDDPARKVTISPEEEKRTILYIEDNLSNLTLVQQILDEHADIELMTAMQGSIGLELARRHSPDLILLDLHLPDMPGWEVLAQLRGDQKTCSIPTIVISADATARQIERLMAAGASAYLTKPLDVDQFVRVLDQNGKTTCATEPTPAKP
jgi:PAS domain S-box-containing protein